MTILLVKPQNATTTTTTTGVLDVCLNHANCIACSSSSQLTSMYSFKEGFPHVRLWLSCLNNIGDIIGQKRRMKEEVYFVLLSC